ncbi:hypothetical protein [Streptomyces sp. NPDC057854]|uniref:hypothetical protein n=1 Tax=unclassified Streptomyces TaxID=2593676 RepID=UPI00367A6BCB
MPQQRTGLGRLLRTLHTTYPHWLLSGAAGRHGLIVRDTATPTVWSRTSYCGSIADATLRAAISGGYVLLGSPEPVPEYDHGRGPWRYEDGRLGRPIALAVAARRMTLGKLPN